jgi:hypothetical protein
VRGTLLVADDAMAVGSGGALVTMRLVEATGGAPLGEGELGTRSNFFLGSDRSRWRSGVPSYARVRASWRPGVDLVWYGGARGLEYDVLVDATVDASTLAFDVDGASSLHVRDDGELAIATARGTIVQARPRVVQDGRDLASRWRIVGPRRVGFELEGYDRGRAVLIDPVVLAYGSYVGGSGDDGGGAIAVDGTGAVYVGGYTESANFPTASPYQATAKSAQDAFVAKIGPAGGAPVFATYLGGGGDEYVVDVAADATGVYLTGATYSSNYPTASAHQSAFGGDNDAFVTKLDPTGATLIYSTYLGGSDFDDANGLAIDASGAVYVVGDTRSPGLGTPGAYKSSIVGQPNGFVAKFSAAGALAYYTYLGGTGGDNSNAIAVDQTGAAYVTGNTQSSDFPTLNAYQATRPGNINAYVTELDAAGATLLYSTYLGGSVNEYGYGIAVDAAGAVYVAGITSSPNFPTKNAVKTTLGANADGFVTKLAANGSSLMYSTYLGGSGEDMVRGLAIDAAGDVYVTGYEDSTDFPTTTPWQATNAGARDTFLTRFDPSGAITYSTYLGGNASEDARSVRLDGDGGVYVGGETTSTNFPTADAGQATYGGGASDVFVAKLGPFPVPDAGVPDAGSVDVDAGLDAGVEAGLDAGLDSGLDAGVPSPAPAPSGNGTSSGSAGAPLPAADAGAPLGSPDDSSGCGCRTALGGGNGLAWGTAALLVSLAVVRRRRGRS